MILHNIGRVHFLSEEGGGTGIIYIGYIIQRRDGYPGTRFITRSGTRVKKYPEIRALILTIALAITLIVTLTILLNYFVMEKSTSHFSGPAGQCQQVLRLH